MSYGGFTVEQAVWIGALIGPMQMLARVIEWSFAEPHAEREEPR